jgi:uncharacterized protein with HEPN domain
MSIINTDTSICIKKNGEYMNVYNELVKIRDNIVHTYTDMNELQCITIGDMTIERNDITINVYDEIKRMKETIRYINNNIEEDRNRYNNLSHRGMIHTSDEIEFGNPRMKLIDTMNKTQDDIRRLFATYQQFHTRHLIQC